MSRTVAIRVVMDGTVQTFTEWSDELLTLPITQVLKFQAPSPPPSPHTAEQHEELMMWPRRLNQLMITARENRRCLQ